MRLYISGAMSGFSDMNFPKFNSTAKDLRYLGYEAVNPAQDVPARVDNPKWEDYMRVDIEALTKCDAVVVLDGWHKSKGATIEVYIATVLGMKILNESLYEINPKEYIDQSILLEFIGGKR